ncbi:MAG: hypothetical protein JW797_08270 [Bradymonadales bacterium]|nr:hypothetical protein [Bradymonadales bacterium]
MRKVTWLFAALSTLVLAGTIFAQNWSAAPLFGELTLTSGFAEDPQSVQVMAGGETDASALGLMDPTGGPCRGHISAAQPDFRLHYTAGAFPLRFYVVSAADTTLLINTPDATWRCNDDASIANYSGLNPVVHLATPANGQYDIWIGTYSPGTPQQATLYITELEANHPGMHAQ